MLRAAVTRCSRAVVRVPARQCGLFAAVDAPGGARTRPAVADAACTAMAHRGPDGAKTASGVFELGGAKRDWALGHTRLAIVAPDQAQADMPFQLSTTVQGSAGGRVCMVANGEIYNHDAIYADIAAAGYDTAAAVQSASDCEAIGHAYAHGGIEYAAKALDGMFAFVIVDEAAGKLAAARDPCGIKPLYYATAADGEVVGFASELKGLLHLPNAERFDEFPPGHYWTDADGFSQYYAPEWKQYVPADATGNQAVPAWEKPGEEPTVEELRDALDGAVKKRLMSDVKFGMFLSGGIDSCIVGQLMMKHCREMGFPHPPSFTVGMENGPDVMAARAMAEELGTTHYEKIFTVEEALEVIDEVVYHIETYNAELIRSAVPNWFLAELASEHVKMVITGEGADELWAGYAYFEDAPSPEALHRELVRIYGALAVANLQRTDRITMAHGIEARVPFLDVEYTRLAMSVDPARKTMVKGGASHEREKAYLRRMFEREHDGCVIPEPVLWRMKAMQCEGVGEGWVAKLQAHVSSKVTDAQMAEAAARYPHDTPQTKEEYYYRTVFEKNFPGCEHVPTLWEGGCRAGGAEWQSDAYTREGLADVSRLTHALQDADQAAGAAAAAGAR